MPTVDVETKLRKLTVINYNSYNWSWLLDLNRPPELPVITKMLPLGKSQPAPEPEEPAREESLPAVDLEKSRVPGWMVPTKKKRALAQSSCPSRPRVNSGFLWFFVW